MLAAAVLPALALVAERIGGHDVFPLGAFGTVLLLARLVTARSGIDAPTRLATQVHLQPQYRSPMALLAWSRYTFCLATTLASVNVAGGLAKAGKVKENTKVKA